MEGLDFKGVRSGNWCPIYVTGKRCGGSGRRLLAGGTGSGIAQCHCDGT